MSNFSTEPGNVLYLVVSACPPALQTVDRIRTEQAEGWDVCAILTPQATKWLDVGEIERVTGHPVQTEMLLWPTPPLEPLGNRLLAAPITFNTLNKVAAGLADTMATGLLCEAIGNPDIEVVMEPSVSAEFSRHPVFARNVELLQAAGVRFVGDGGLGDPPWASAPG